MTGTTTAIEALKKAITLEDKGHKFYLKAADLVSDPKGAKMFLSLADDEVKHKDILKRTLEGKSEGVLDEIQEVKADLETPLFPAATEIKKAVHPESNELDALLFAIGIESDSFHLYQEQATATTDANAKKIYEYLVQAERTHFNLLMLNYEYLSKTGHWSD